MFRKVIFITMLCCLAVCAGCSDSDPLYQDQFAQSEATIAAQEGQIAALSQEKQAAVDEIASLERKVESQEKEIDALERDVSEQENAPQSQTVVKGRLNVKAGTYSSRLFTVKSGMKNVRLQGDFWEVGGRTLYVAVFDDLNFRNWVAGGDSKSLYSSGEVAVGEINLSIRAAGAYHLVFSNTHSWFTQKNVEATVDLWFQM
ncbi:hypothetical protein ACFL6S_08210 [Candidatus Poribacteria bacterium]